MGITAEDLLHKDFPEPKWAVPGVLPEGLNILAGKPKQGKSIMALNLALAIATGGVALGNVRVDPGLVVYLALEDTQRRLKKRILQMTPQRTTPLDGLWLFTSWHRMHENGLDELSGIVSSATRLVIIDTFALFRPPGKKSGSIYAEDYENISQIKKFADEHEVCVLLIHHLRKMESHDPFDCFSGTLGLTGAADGLLALIKRGGNTTLHITGRDVEAQEFAMRFDPVYLSWSILGRAEEVQSTQPQQILYDCLKDSKKALTPKQIATLTGLRVNYVSKTIPKLLGTDIVRTDRGKYIFCGKNGKNGKNDHNGNIGKNTGNVPSQEIKMQGGNNAGKNYKHNENNDLCSVVPIVPNVPTYKTFGRKREESF